jgi:hypothetical protein
MDVLLSRDVDDPQTPPSSMNLALLLHSLVPVVVELGSGGLKKETK